MVRVTVGGVVVVSDDLGEYLYRGGLGILQSI